MTEYTEPIDWNDYWTHADEADYESATPSRHHLRDLVPAFIAETGIPESIADVGCGPGVLTFALARTYPEATIVGYDVSETILEENRTRATNAGLDNLRFERTALPAFEPEERFDLVCCYGTLSYVRESERALRALHEAVRPGGHLILGYVNDRGRAHYQGWLEDPEATRERNPDFDPDRFAQRFKLVLEGESTLSYRAIHDALGTWPRSFWEVVEKPEERWAWQHVPLVWVPRQATGDENTAENPR